MIFKFLLIAGLVFASAQATPEVTNEETIDPAQIEDLVNVLDGILKELLEKIHDFVSEIEINKPEIPDWVPDPLIRLLRRIILNIEVGPISVGEIICFVRHFDELVEQVKVTTTDAVTAANALSKRREEIKECSNIGGIIPLPSDLIARRRCKKAVDEGLVGQEAREATAVLSKSIFELLRLEYQIRNCL